MDQKKAPLARQGGFLPQYARKLFYGVLQNLSGLELRNLASGDLDFRAGTGIAASASLTFAHAEGTETGQGQFVTGSQFILNDIQNGIHGSFSLSFGSAVFFRNFRYEFSFGHKKLL
jgi:hypothetical protein